MKTLGIYFPECFELAGKLQVSMKTLGIYFHECFELDGKLQVSMKNRILLEIILFLHVQTAVLVVAAENVYLSKIFKSKSTYYSEMSSLWLKEKTR